MNLSIGDLLHHDEPAALTRRMGKAVYPRLAEWLKGTPEPVVVRIVIPDRLIVDYSFADETIGRLLEELVAGTWGDRYAIVEASSDIQFDNLSASVRLRKVAALVRFQGSYHLIIANDVRGQDELSVTVELVNKYSSVTASELARDHGLGPTGWNNRLARAHRLRLIYREPETLLSGGRQYVYSSLTRKE